MTRTPGRCTDAPVRVTIEAVGMRPTSIPKKLGTGRLWRTRKPDVDNVCKSCLDALVTAGVLRDDVLVAELVARSLVAAADEAPHVRIVVEELPPRELVGVAAKKGPAPAPGSLL